jgi:hypothetical protein
MTVDEFREKMKDKKSEDIVSDPENYKKFFNKEVKDLLAGCWNPNDGVFEDIGKCSCMWLAGGNNATFFENKWHRGSHARNYGFSGRLLKN